MQIQVAEASPSPTREEPQLPLQLASVQELEKIQLPKNKLTGTRSLRRKRKEYRLRSRRLQTSRLVVTVMKNQHLLHTLIIFAPNRDMKEKKEVRMTHRLAVRE